MRLPPGLNGHILVFLLDILFEPLADGNLQRTLCSLAPRIPPVSLCERRLAPPDGNTRTAGASP